MRKYQLWVLTLGLMVATPGMAFAGPFSKKTDEPAASTQKSTNQQTANAIANALRAARLSGYDMDIEFNDGVASVVGKISTVKQKETVTQVVSQVPGVQRVDNQLELLSISRNPFARSLGGSKDNQQMAQDIAQALGRGNFQGYDIEIRYQDGTALLSGVVQSPEEQAKATYLVQQVKGVKVVNNQLRIPGRPAGPAGNVVPVNHVMPVQEMAMQQGMGAPGGVPMQQAGMPGPPTYGHPGSGATHQVYNMPQLPEYAWPSYASYPNSAQISYPEQYSASAWPYIGPFYPYPQIPLGWRQAQLEWDDGYWSLNFNPRTDKWWWFLSPKNW